MPKKKLLSNSYQYIDPHFTYINPNSGILFNLQGIEDPEVFIFFESGSVAKRLNQLHANPIKIIGIETLFEIHKFLFQDIFSWAGETRKVEISKDGKQFFPIAFFESGFKYLENLINAYKSIPKDDKLQLSEKLAEILDNLNYLHPFREGNGRTQREFLRVLALEKGYSLSLNPPDNKDIYDRYMNGTIDSDLKILNALIFEQLMH